MKKISMETLVGLFVLICLVCVGYLTIKLGKMELVGEDHYMLKARFRSVAGLRAGSSVDMAGVEIGRVAEINLDPQRALALVVMKIQKDVPVTDDTIASVKTSGLIGDKYISLSPGGSELILKSGDTITETESAVDIEGLISKYAFGSVKKE
jgi:phospholipid/cholesterol/gamma-HCH transport system substrate-binding protein